MITLKDGPAQGSYAVKRAPLFLRAVVGPGNKQDVLDQLDDTPRADERVYIYRLEGEVGWAHVHFGGKDRARTGFYATGTYRHLADVDGEALRETAAWRQWCISHAGSPVNPQTGEIVSL